MYCYLKYYAYHQITYLHEKSYTLKTCLISCSTDNQLDPLHLPPFYKDVYLMLSPIHTLWAHIRTKLEQPKHNSCIDKHNTLGGQIGDAIIGQTTKTNRKQTGTLRSESPITPRKYKQMKLHTCKPETVQDISHGSCYK